MNKTCQKLQKNTFTAINKNGLEKDLSVKKVSATDNTVVLSNKGGQQIAVRAVSNEQVSVAQYLGDKVVEGTQIVVNFCQSAIGSVLKEIVAGNDEMSLNN